MIIGQKSLATKQGKSILSGISKSTSQQTEYNIVDINCLQVLSYHEQ